MKLELNEKEIQALLNSLGALPFVQVESIIQFLREKIVRVEAEIEVVKE